MPVDDEFEGGRPDGFADGFTLALHGAAALAPDQALHSLATRAERIGRRRRNRRRAGLAGGLAVLALAGSLTAFGRGTGTIDPAHRPKRPLTSTEAVQAVIGLLPPGSSQVLHAQTPGTPGPTGDPYRTDGALLFDDGKGPSIISYTVERTELVPAVAAVCMDPLQMPQDSCERTTLPSGSMVVIDKLRDTNLATHKEWRATWAAPDGRRVLIIEHNGEASASNRTDPPLDTEQLRALVAAPGWQQIFDALPSRKNAPTPPAPEPAAPDLRPTLLPLLPQGAVLSGTEGTSGTPFTVTFEGRTSMLVVITGPAGKRGIEDKEYAESSPPGPLEVRGLQADGSTVVTNSFGNGKTATTPVLHWTAAVYYPDGRSVTATLWNGENGYTFRPGTPALDLDQLKTIVTAPAWRP